MSLLKNICKNILIIGASGFLGSNLVSKIYGKNDYNIFCSSSNLSLVDNSKNWLYLDVTKPETIDNLPRNIDIIYYMAMSPHHRDFPDRANDIFDVNVQGLFTILEYARKTGVNKFILASSGSVYNESCDLITEETPLAIGDNCSFYAASKIAAEALISSYSQYFTISCLRCFYPYGKNLSDSMLISRMVYNIQNNLQIMLDGEDGFEFNPIYVDDAVDAFIAASNLNGFHIINIAGPERITLGGICRIISDLVVKKPYFINGGKSRSLVSSIEKMRNLLCSPKIMISEGIRFFVYSRAEKNEEKN
jgi:nucleoside-diphosphate-sugar epimerase